jgi:hypothetical protein
LVKAKLHHIKAGTPNVSLARGHLDRLPKKGKAKKMSPLPRTEVQAKSLVRSDDAAGLCKKINICIEKAETAVKKAEQFYTTAAIHIRDLQAKFPKTWPLLLKEHCGFGRSRAFEILAIADGRTSEEKVRSGNAERQRISREKAKQSESVTVTDDDLKAPLQWVAADCKDESGLQWHEAKLPHNHRYAVIPRAADHYDVMFDRTYLDCHAPTVEAGKALAEAHCAGRELESAVPTPPMPVETTISGDQADEPTAPAIDKFEDDISVSEDVEDPAIVLSNILDSIQRAQSVARAWRKIWKLSSFDRDAKKKISDEIDLLIRNWRSVAALKTLATEGDDPELPADQMKAKLAALEQPATEAT